MLFQLLFDLGKLAVAIATNPNLYIMSNACIMQFTTLFFPAENILQKKKLGNTTLITSIISHRLDFTMHKPNRKMHGQVSP